MTFIFNWDGISLMAWLAIIYLIACSIGFRFYARNKREDVKRKCDAYGKYFLFMSVVYVMVVVLSKLEIYNVNAILVAMLSAFALGLVYIDGWLTQKAVGGDLAVEANPIADMLFNRFGFKKIRVAIFVLVAGLVIYSSINGDIAVIFALCLIWVLVDGNNIVVWHKIKQAQRLKESVIEGEIGFGDIHEL